MRTVYTKIELSQVVEKEKNNNRKIGFVPTMGALHKGHLSLVEAAKQKCDFVVVSIFVNPTQFNNPKDLETYPRTIEADLNLLQTVGCDLAFVPSVSEMYPETDNRIFEFNGLDKVMEGACRAGHFNGVAQIVSKLFYAVNPDYAFFGEKDFQQIAIIKEMVRQLKFDLEIVPCPIVREADGLALSSRNTLMNEEQRKSSLKISKALFKLQQNAKTMSFNQLIEVAKSEIDSDPLLTTEYLEIVDVDNLLPVSSLDHPNGLQACVAVQVLDSVRLIDNVRVK